MAEVGEIAKLFGFIGKNTSVGSHVAAAATGVAAKGAYNFVTGRDVTDGMMSGAVMGAAGNVGWKTYKHVDKAGRVASAMNRLAESSSKLDLFISKMRAAGGATGKDARAALRAEARGHAVNKIAAQKDLGALAKDMGLGSKAPAAVRPVQEGGSAVAESVARQKAGVNAGASLKSNQPINPSQRSLAERIGLRHKEVVAGRKSGPVHDAIAKRTAAQGLARARTDGQIGSDVVGQYQRAVGAPNAPKVGEKNLARASKKPNPFTAFASSNPYAPR